MHSISLSDLRDIKHKTFFTEKESPDSPDDCQPLPSAMDKKAGLQVDSPESPPPESAEDGQYN